MNAITEAQWADYENYNRPGHTAWADYHRADPARARKCQRAMDLARADQSGKRPLFASNLAAANEIAAAAGLPALTLDDALAYYGRGGHDYAPSAPDRGGNNAGAGGIHHVARWSICVVLHEGPMALADAGDAQDAAAEEFARIMPAIQEYAHRIAVCTQDYHE
jgi:hypothetical protein